MILRSCEAHLEAQELAEKLKEICDEEFQGPFPYDDCRWLMREFGGELGDLIPDLDLWVINHIGFATRGSSLLSFSREQTLRARGLVSVSFYEQHPEYGWLERHITESQTADLFEYLEVSNKLRLMLMSLFDLMLKEQYIDSSPPQKKRLERTRR